MFYKLLINYFFGKFYFGFMRRLISTMVLVVLFYGASAQQVISLDSKGQSSVTAKDGQLAINIAGMSFSFGGEKKSSSPTSGKTTKKSVAQFAYAGITAPKYNHLSLFEIGTNFLVQTDFSAMDKPVATALDFSSRKAVQCTINLMTMNVPLNPKRTLGFTLGFGFEMNNYTFNDKVLLKYEQGSFVVEPLQQSIKKSKLAVTYIHIPMLFDWNIRRGFFISAGATFDILMGSQLSYKKPKTKIEGKLPLNPVQVGVTSRIGWRRVYAFVNYSLLNMYKNKTDITARRMSAGVGLYF